MLKPSINSSLGMTVPNNSGNSYLCSIKSIGFPRLSFDCSVRMNSLTSWVGTCNYFNLFRNLSIKIRLIGPLESIGKRTSWLISWEVNSLRRITWILNKIWSETASIFLFFSSRELRMKSFSRLPVKNAFSKSIRSLIILGFLSILRVVFS